MSIVHTPLAIDHRLTTPIFIIKPFIYIHLPNPYFQFKQFTVFHDRCSMKVTTDSCLFGAWVAHAVNGLAAGKNILDIGSGSGLLSLMIAQQTKAGIDGIEIQANDYNQSLENIAEAPFGKRIAIYHSDALQFSYDKTYDAIVSNPPFYESDLKGASGGKNIAHHDEGLKLNDLFLLIKKTLAPDGHFYLLLPAKRSGDFKRLCAENGFYINELAWIHPSEAHQPFRIMISASFRTLPPKEHHLYIKQKNEYSPSFRKLLAGYYRHL